MKIKITSTDKEKWQHLIGQEFEVKGFSILDPDYPDEMFIIIPVEQCEIVGGFAEAITKMRLTGNIQSEDPEVVMSVVLSMLYKQSKKMQ